MIDDYMRDQQLRQMVGQGRQGGKKVEDVKPKPPKRPQSKNKMRPILTIALRDRITEIVETRTPDAKEMSFEEKVYYLQRIMQNFKKNFYEYHPNQPKYAEGRGWGESRYETHQFFEHIHAGGLFKEFEALDAFLAEVNEGEA